MVYSYIHFLYPTTLVLRVMGKMKIYIKIFNYDKDKVLVSSFDGFKQWEVTWGFHCCQSNSGNWTVM